jgi:excisionase family DNA binding protein
VALTTSGERPVIAKTQREHVVAQIALALAFDQELAFHVWRALLLYRDWLPNQGYVRPPGFVDVLMAVERAAKGHSGSEGTFGDASGEAVGPAACTGPREVFNQTEAAKVLGVSPRTVRRMIDRGEIQTVPRGARRRVPRAELSRLISSSAPTADDPGPSGGGRARKETT